MKKFSSKFLDLASKGGQVENWGEIKGFPGYSVSDLGHVRNDETGRVLTILRNQYGTCYVGLTKGRKQHRRSLAQLVAQTFVPNPRAKDSFDGLIHLNNDKANNRADNLLWRPHWFVVKYLIQANRGPIGSDKPVLEIKHHEIYPNTWEASLAFGLIERDLIGSIVNRTFTWPTFQEFRYVAE
jgi:hypothetical protein